VALALCASVFGCSAATRNVRAFRAYAHERSNITVSVDRIEDLAAILELTDRVLTRTPYTPGDKWVSALALDDDEAKRLKTEIRKEGPYQDVDYEIPTIKLYRVHLEQVLADAKKARPTGEAQFESLLDAASTLAAASKDIKEQWNKVRSTQEDLGKMMEAKEKAAAEHPQQANQPEPAEVTEAKAKVVAAEKAADEAKTDFDKSVAALKAVDATKPDNKLVLKDELLASTLALRLDLEALALIPIVVVQTVRSLPDAPKDLIARPSLESVGQIAAVPWRVEAIEHRLGRQLTIMQQMASSLATVMKVEIEKTAAFTMKESIVDQIVGIGLDSFRINLHAGGEMFFFAQPGGGDSVSTSQTQDANGNTKTVTKDFTGRTQRLSYDVDPIILLRANLNVGFDAIHLPNAGNMNFGYATDRVFSSGGNKSQAPSARSSASAASRATCSTLAWARSA
jgi:hypothetical protein